MTGTSNPWRSDPHRDAQVLLPWYVNGQLTSQERTCVETHLAACSECRAELAQERQLLGSVANASIDVELGWASLRRRLDQPSDRPASVKHALDRATPVARKILRTGGPWLGWAAAAAAAAMLLVNLGAQAPVRVHEARYHTLGAPSAPMTANIVVMFRPDASEQDLRRSLGAVNARIMDGPTAAGAYLVHAANRSAALATLRRSPDVTLAEPIDAAPPR